MTEFNLSVHQNEFMPRGATEVHAIVTIASTGSVSPMRALASKQAKAVVVMGDVSGSMQERIDPNNPNSQEKIVAARYALAAAVNQIDDGIEFAVIAGTDRATMVYPPTPELAVSSAQTRQYACDAIAKLRASGGTAMSTWLSGARALLQQRPGSIRLGILITDGQNDSDSEIEFEREIDRCVGVFECNCRGVGVNWNVAEVRKISTKLLGDLEMIRDGESMTADFKALIGSAMAKATADVTLRVWTPKTAQIVFIKQVAPSIEDYTNRGTQISELIKAYPTASWGQEERDYHLCIRVQSGEVSDEMLAARVSLAVGDVTVTQSLVRAVWTDDVGLSTRIVPEVAHYTGQVKLAAAIQEGLAARAEGNTRTATVKLGEAVRLANESGNSETIKLLERVVDVENPVTGTVRLKASFDKGDEMELDTRSTKTVRVKKG